MASEASQRWTDELRATLARYRPTLLRKVADALLRSRQRRSDDELIEKLTATTTNAAVIDRRLRDLDPPARGLLALVGLSRQPRWRLGALLELLSGLAAADGLAVVADLFGRGLLFPELPANGAALASFDDWLGRGSATDFRVFAHPHVTARAIAQDAPLPRLAGTVTEVQGVREADGLEFFLRLGVLWQQVRALPLRLTQQGDFFKRDQERLGTDPLLTAPAVDELTPLPDPGHLLVGLGLHTGLLRQDDAQIVAGAIPDWWHAELTEALTRLWAAWPELTAWEPAEGWRGLRRTSSPYASAGLLALGLLAQLGEDEWIAPAAVEEWIGGRHCCWNGQASPVSQPSPPRREGQGWTEGFLLGLAYQLRLVQAAKDRAGGWVVRLSPVGWGVLTGRPAPALPAFTKTLLVQPNLEVLAYRQGLTPGLIAELSRFATWKGLGAACTLQLDADSVYRGLEMGATLAAITQTLQQHGVRELPASVGQSLRTWADKRERLAVYPAATLLEFTTPEELHAALARGLPGLRISDRLLLVGNENDIDFRHFRLVGTRDYALPPDQCVAVGPDGVTLEVDLARADLLLETELKRFAEPVATDVRANRRTYRLTPGSLARGREAGLTTRALEDWFVQRTGQLLTPAAQLLLAGPETPALVVRTLTVVAVPSAALADGLMQWPETSRLIQARLGPQALAIAADQVDALRAKLAELGLSLEGEESE
jgi:hypothetical protein